MGSIYTPEEWEINAMIGANIKHFRGRRGWRQNDLAQQLGLSQYTLYSYEVGRTIIPAHAVVRIGQILDVPVVSMMFKRKEIA